MVLAADQIAALAPVRAAMLERARARADAVIARARAEADAAVEQARADGAAQARPAAAAEVSRSRRAARAAVLQRELALREDLAARIATAIRGLRDGPEYPRLRSRLAEAAGRAAGPGAVITEHPDGGVIARAGGVVVDCSLPRLADRVVAALGGRIAELCAG